jgi:hypothetical protein
MRHSTVAGNITEMHTKWKALQESKVALAGEDLDALRDMPKEELVRLAWDALGALEAMDDFSYEIAMIEQHCDTAADTVCAWVVSQAQPDGGFNKFVKTVGGYTPEQGPGGDVMVFLTWVEAKAALDYIIASVRPNFRIYPVVIAAGREPRTTNPEAK